jgi:hypothetical protein
LGASAGAVAYDSMPLLNAFIKVKWYQAEIFNNKPSSAGDDPALPSSTTCRPGRVARHDDPTVGPNNHFNRAYKPYTCFEGAACDALHRGIPEVLVLPLLWDDIINYWLLRLESRWGADSHDFNPFRWLDGTEFRKEAVGPYANLYVKI